ncbi:unnamed protein product, partial [Timema podura]|nr:unnamed protein product [Timema podura]
MANAIMKIKKPAASTLRANVWANCLMNLASAKLLRKLQKAILLLLSCTYSTNSNKALCVTLGIILLDVEVSLGSLPRKGVGIWDSRGSNVYNGWSLALIYQQVNNNNKYTSKRKMTVSATELHDLGAIGNKCNTRLALADDQGNNFPEGWLPCSHPVWPIAVTPIKSKHPAGLQEKRGTWN